MKSAVIPQVRVEPELRAELESVLQNGETLSEFVEASVRSAVEFRRVQTRFHERGEAAWQDYQRTRLSVPADEVLAKLQAKLDAKRKRLGK
jgi:Arc/MetJ-type ribon-helix-helix transcriptional regulator